ncbi:hypothetical protein [Rhizobium sp. AN80A]|uniref:hypothetical protein n=1 Tax=Rhizobium sp. AN80A TaxID=3040673 RepID=UPI0024B3926A|nr:hypothetical protein [Rhizobium sp. AN80A]
MRSQPEITKGWERDENGKLRMDVIAGAAVVATGPNTIVVKLDYTGVDDQSAKPSTVQIAMPVSVAVELQKMLQMAVASTKSPPTKTKN